MPSPFPGMNPYLERDVAWHDFHERFLILGAGLIGAQIRPNYVVRVDDHIFVHELPEEPRRSGGYADIALPPTDETREASLEIRDRHTREVVTVLDLLSPANKRRTGVDRAQYLAKRNTLLPSQTHLVEIDLLRGGGAMPGATLSGAPEGRPNLSLGQCPRDSIAPRLQPLSATGVPRPLGVGRVIDPSDAEGTGDDWNWGMPRLTSRGVAPG